MSKKWYPVIDYEKCIECGSCVVKCKHGVYNKAKAPTPVVINPDSCIEGCHGCGNLCPVGAISYVGDNNITKDNGCGCGDSCNDSGGCC